MKLENITEKLEYTHAFVPSFTFIYSFWKGDFSSALKKKKIFGYKNISMEFFPSL